MVDSVAVQRQTDYASRFRLRSLCDMLRFYAAPFIHLTARLGRLAGMLAMFPDEDSRAQVETAVAGIQGELNKLPVSNSLKQQAERFRQSIATVPNRDTLGIALARMTELQMNMAIELQDHCFLVVRPDLREHYEQTEAPFGSSVETEFPDSSYDIRHATALLAVEEWTASVFHAMRALEKALHYLASLLGVTVPGGIEYTDWGPTVTQMEKKIEAMQQLSKGAEKDEKLTFYSGLAANFTYFKDGWRNPVSHSRAIYDEQDAMRVWNHARDFMQRLAEHKGAAMS